MSRLLQVQDKAGRLIYLTDERWHHITSEHPEITPYFHEFCSIIQRSHHTMDVPHDAKIKYFYHYFKNRREKAKNLLLVVKYLNGEGFIVTAYFVRHIP